MWPARNIHSCLLIVFLSIVKTTVGELRLSEESAGLESQIGLFPTINNNNNNQHRADLLPSSKHRNYIQTGPQRRLGDCSDPSEIIELRESATVTVDEYCDYSGDFSVDVMLGYFTLEDSESFISWNINPQTTGIYIIDITFRSPEIGSSWRVCINSDPCSDINFSVETGTSSQHLLLGGFEINNIVRIEGNTPGLEIESFFIHRLVQCGIDAAAVDMRDQISLSTRNYCGKNDVEFDLRHFIDFGIRYFYFAADDSFVAWHIYVPRTNPYYVFVSYWVDAPALEPVLRLCPLSGVCNGDNELILDSPFGWSTLDGILLTEGFQSIKFQSSIAGLTIRQLIMYESTPEPDGDGSSNPSQSPTKMPSLQPSGAPTRIPSSMPSGSPSLAPSRTPSSRPSSQPSTYPSQHPSNNPSGSPSKSPTAAPSLVPSFFPSNNPSRMPIGSQIQIPSSKSTGSPTLTPSRLPSGRPSSYPSIYPSQRPSIIPSGSPSKSPTAAPSLVPSFFPSNNPSRMPIGSQIQIPSSKSTGSPTLTPSRLPSGRPSSYPSIYPSQRPSIIPSGSPSKSPTAAPSLVPSFFPSNNPSRMPNGGSPTLEPSHTPSMIPSSQQSINRNTNTPIGSVSEDPPSLPSREPSPAFNEAPTTSHPSSKLSRNPHGPTPFPSSQSSSLHPSRSHPSNSMPPAPVSLTTVAPTGSPVSEPAPLRPIGAPPSILLETTSPSPRPSSTTAPLMSLPPPSQVPSDHDDDNKMVWSPSVHPSGTTTTTAAVNSQPVPHVSSPAPTTTVSTLRKEMTTPTSPSYYNPTEEEEYDDSITRATNGVVFRLRGRGLLTDEELDEFRRIGEDWLEDNYYAYFLTQTLRGQPPSSSHQDALGRGRNLEERRREGRVIRVGLEFVSQVITLQGTTTINTVTYNEIITYSSRETVQSFAPDVLKHSVLDPDAIPDLLQRLREGIPSMADLEGVEFIVPPKQKGGGTSGLSDWAKSWIMMSCVSVTFFSALKYYSWRVYGNGRY